MSEREPIYKRIFVMQPRPKDFRFAKWIVRPIPDFNVSEDAYLRVENYQSDYAHERPEIYYHSSEVDKLKERVRSLESEMRQSIGLKDLISKTGETNAQN